MNAMNLFYKTLKRSTYRRENKLEVLSFNTQENGGIISK